MAGIHVVEPDVADLDKAVAEGYEFVAFASDMLLFSHHIDQLSSDIGRVRSRGDRT